MVLDMSTNNGMSMNEIAMVGRDDADAATNEMMLPDGSFMDGELSDFMAQGYLMGSDCFGSNSKQYADKLMDFINDEYADSYYYNTLARRASSASSRKLFKSIAANELEHSKRFAAAYFLISGKRYFPTKGSVENVAVPSVHIQAIRQGYLKETQDAVKYHIFSRKTSDRCLKRIAEDTSFDEKQHAAYILKLLQNM